MALALPLLYFENALLRWREFLRGGFYFSLVHLGRRLCNSEAKVRSTSDPFSSENCI